MNIDIIRRIDRDIGPLVCRFLLLLKWLFSSSPDSDNNFKGSPKNILIIKFFGMGSILLASPALDLLKREYPSAKITIFTLSINKRICEILPSIDEVICLDIRNVFSFLLNFIKLIFDIRRRNFDVVVDLEFITNFSALVSLLATLFLRGKITVGFNSPLLWRNRVHNLNVSFSHSAHITKIFLKVAHSLGVESNELFIEPERRALLRYADKEYMERIIRNDVYLSHCDLFVAVNINAGELSFHRRWPKEYFVLVVEALIKRPKTMVLLIGGSSDLEYVSEFMKLFPHSSRIVNLCGKTSLEELLGLFDSCHLLITNDGGPLHIAEFVGLNTISFFGPETPSLYGPIYGEHHVFYEDIYCSPCLNIYNSKMSRCTNNLCLKAINPDKVIELIEDKINNIAKIKNNCSLLK